MTTRIDDYDTRVNDRRDDERHRDLQKKTVQRDFARRLLNQKMCELRHQGVALRPMPKPVANEKRKDLSLREPPNFEALHSKKSLNKDTGKEKDDPSKDAKAEANNERKRADLKLENAVKRKSESKDEEHGFQESEAFFQYAAILGSQPTTGNSGLQKNAGPSLPQVVIDQIVRHINSFTNEKGQKEVSIELKDGVLSGAQINMTAKNGRVTLRFSNLNAQTTTLLRNSQIAIAKRLKEKNLSLSEFLLH